MIIVLHKIHDMDNDDIQSELVKSFLHVIHFLYIFGQKVTTIIGFFDLPAKTKMSE